MTQQEFLDRHYHLYLGLIYDAACGNRHGAELALWMGVARRHAHENLVAIYQNAYPPKPLPVNGNGLAPVRKL